MTPFLRWLTAALFLALPAASLAGTAEVTAKMDDIWLNRSGDTANMREALALADQAWTEGQTYDVAWRAARAAFWICDRTEDSATDLEFGQKGYQWGEKAMALKADGVEGHYYYACSLGEYSKGMSIVVALTKGLGNKYLAECNKAISLNGRFDHGGPYRALGRYYFEVPWPKYDAAKAEQNYRAASGVDGNFGRTWYYLAELYGKEGNTVKEKEALDKLAAIPSLPEAKWEQTFYQDQGKALAAKMK